MRRVTDLLRALAGTWRRGGRDAPVIEKRVRCDWDAALERWWRRLRRRR